LQFFPIIFLAGSRAFRFSLLAGYSSANGFQRAPSGRRFQPGVTATCYAGLPLQSLPEHGQCKKKSFACNIFLPHEVKRS
jgi:hypothetical protein